MLHQNLRTATTQQKRQALFEIWQSQPHLDLNQPHKIRPKTTSVEPKHPVLRKQIPDEVAELIDRFNKHQHDAFRFR